MCARLSALLGLAALVGLGLVIGCSDDGGPRPVRMVSIAVDSTGVDICTTLELAAQVVGGERRGVDWYVNGVLGGASAFGTITQTNPATLAAPDSIPESATVTVKAVSREDGTKADSCRVTIELRVVHVSAAAGSDETGNGCITKPFKTITRGLAQAETGCTVLAAPGTYDEANGEVFPLDVDGVTVAGENWTTTIIRGHNPDDGYRAALYLRGAAPALRRLTLEMGEPASPRWNVAMYVTGDAVGAVVDSVRVSEYGNYSIIRIDGSHSTTVSNCRFEIAGDQTYGRGFEVVFGDTSTVIRDCTVSGFHTGIFFNYPSDALVEGCTAVGNQIGVEICCLNDVNSDPGPDLGGGARGSAGGNTIQNNAAWGLLHSGTKTIYAKHNTWNNSPPTTGPAEGSDIYTQGTGSVIWE